MQHFYRKLLICCIPLVLLACRYEQKEPGKLIAGSRTPGSYSFDRNFLRQQDPKLIELEDEDARVLVSARYQAKVFTSTADIEEGKSFLVYLVYK